MMYSEYLNDMKATDLQHNWRWRRCWYNRFLTLLLPILLLNHCVSYFCHATATTTTTQTAPHSLGVHVVRAPESAVAPKGDEVVFECELNLKPDRLEWRFRPSNAIQKQHYRYRYLPVDESNNITRDEHLSKLRIYVVPETLGDYQCVAWFGPTAIASTSARLTLVSISIDNSNGYSRNAIRWSVAPKNCILIRCGTVTSNPPAVWSFYRNGEKVPQTEVLPTSSGGALILNSVSAKDSGNYTCSAMNAITGVELKLPQSIDVRVDYTDRTPPYFLVQRPPTQIAARPGETIVLECPGVGSPKPEAVWSSPNIVNIYNNRTKILPYGLQIVDVRPEDQGSYVCRLDNGIAPVLVHMIKLNVLERPHILRGPAATLTNEGDGLELECSASGNPQPDIYWLINGDDTRTDNETYAEDRRLVIKHVQKRHAGIVQCFAKNSVGETSAGNLLEVNPKEIQGELGYTPLGNVPLRPIYEHSGGGGGGGNGGSNKGNKGKRKHMRVANMVPPSRPNVTRLSDDSVMLRWNVPKNDGLPIQFFKVQYRMLGDSTRKIPRENWQTTNEDIPYGKRERSNYGDNNGIKNFTSSVTGLRPNRYYRFRIIAVYSNNDNKEGNTSIKFYLQRGAALGLAKANLPVPDLTDIEPLSESAIVLHWTMLPQQQQQLHGGSSIHFDGFYAYYRPVASAGEYLKATVDGMHARHYKIDMLEAGTAYEFKLQSFNAHAASEFSGIRQGRTKKLHNMPTPTPTAFKPTTHPNQEDNSIYPVVAGAAGGGLLLLIATIAACLCIKRRTQPQVEDENKPQLDHIQADFVTSAVLGVTPHHKTAGTGTGGMVGSNGVAAGAALRLNGVIPRMNITPNPLAQDVSAAGAADKNRNVMELRFMPPPNQTTTTTAASTTIPNGADINTTTNNKTNTTATTIITATATTTADNATITKTTATTKSATDDEHETLLINGNGNLFVQHQTQRSSSSCETLEASEGITTTTTPIPIANGNTAGTRHNTNNIITTTTTTTTTTSNKNSPSNSLEQISPLSKPLPPLPTKVQQQNFNKNVSNINANTNKSNSNTNSNSNKQQQQQQANHHQQSGLHHAQPYQQPPTPTTGTPTMLHKRFVGGDYHQQQQQQHLHQQPPPVPPHQNHHHHNHAQQQQQQHHLNHNNNNISQHHFAHHQQQHQLYQATPTNGGVVAASPTFEHQRRTLERSIRNLQHQQQQQQQQHSPPALPPHHYATPPPPPPLHHQQHASMVNGLDYDGTLPTRIPSLRRTRRTSAQHQQQQQQQQQHQHSGGAHGSSPLNGSIGGSGGIGIPIVPGSPRIQRSPMPARAMIKRTRLGSHTDNISSGSLNSIEV